MIKKRVWRGYYTVEDWLFNHTMLGFVFDVLNIREKIFRNKL
ncbi:hypothetical protein ACVRXA_11295 [Streptococcus pseudopneumoniae]|nr:hypothetical protein [Streptococcus pseudopneumoniae]